MAFGLVIGKPVVALNSWNVTRPGETQGDPMVQRASTAEEAVEWIERRLV